MKSLLLSFLLILFTSCSLFIGEDGQDGQVFLAFDWALQPSNYADNNPDTPLFPDKLEFYQVLPGEYEFSYLFDDGFGWEGTYTIMEAEPGQEGYAFREDGRDGRDSRYILFLSYQGAILTNEVTDLQKISRTQTRLHIGTYIIEISQKPLQGGSHGTD